MGYPILQIIAQKLDAPVKYTALEHRLGYQDLEFEFKEAYHMFKVTTLRLGISLLKAIDGARRDVSDIFEVLFPFM